jgi:hypothetical protein
MAIAAIKNYINANRYAALVTACALGVAFSFAQDAAQVLLLPVAEWMQRRFLATPDATFLGEQVSNFCFQALAALIPSFIVMWAMTRVLNVSSMFYPSIAAICNLVLGLWWLPVFWVAGFPPAMQNALPFLPASHLGWLFVYFGVAFFVVRLGRRPLAG